MILLYNYKYEQIVGKQPRKEGKESIIVNEKIKQID